MPSGGKRENAGRKNKYGEDTKIVTVRVPVSKIKKFRELVKPILKAWEKKAK